MPLSPGPRRRRRGAAIYGGTPAAALPIVATVGASNVTATSAHLIGSINPQGLSGTCWFTYGTTPTMGTIVGTQAVSAVSAPQTITQTLPGLTSGVTYYFALVGQTAAGTVTGAVLTFAATVPRQVTDASMPLIPSGVPAVSIPNFANPFTISAATGASVVEQGSLDEIRSCVLTIVQCPVGACPELPTFGRPDPLFASAPPDARALAAAVQALEPRAEQSVIVSALDDTGADWGIALTGTVTGTGQ